MCRIIRRKISNQELTLVVIICFLLRICLHELLLMLVRFLQTLKHFTPMKELILVLSACLAFLGLFGLVGTIDRQSEELILVKQLNNVQQELLEEVLQENYSQEEIDSICHKHSYYYFKNYYENNYK